MSIQAVNLSKTFGEHKVLKNLNFNIATGEYVSIWGRSGSGKTTLLYILSTLDFTTEGQILLNGKNPKDLAKADLYRLRNQNIGFIFQFHYLLPELTAIENIMLPIRKFPKKDYPSFFLRAQGLLKSFDIADKEGHYPAQLSGGEQQRVAIARALITNPKFIFADEPTGNLDTQNANIVMNILEEIHHKEKTTIVLVTHEPSFAQRAKRVIELVDGQLASDQRDRTLV